MVLMIFGALMVAGGFAAVIYGNFMNNDFSSQLNNYGSSIDPGNIWMIFGVIAIIVGVILIVYGAKKMKDDKQIEQDTKGAIISKFQRNMLNEYQEQLKNGVITREEYQSKKEEILNKGN